MANSGIASCKPVPGRNDRSFPVPRWTSSRSHDSGIDWELSAIVAGSLLAAGMVWSLLSPLHNTGNPRSQPENAAPSGGVIASGSAMNQDGDCQLPGIADRTFCQPVEG